MRSGYNCSEEISVKTFCSADSVAVQIRSSGGYCCSNARVVVTMQFGESTVIAKLLVW